MIRSLLCCIALLGPVICGARPQSDPKVTLELSDAVLLYALRLAFGQAGVNFVIDPSALQRTMAARVSVTLKEVPLTQALQTLLSQERGSPPLRFRVAEGIYTVYAGTDAAEAPKREPPPPRVTLTIQDETLLNALARLFASASARFETTPEAVRIAERARVSARFQNTPLDVAVTQLLKEFPALTHRKEYGRYVIAAASPQIRRNAAPGRVTVTLQNVDASTALKRVLDAAGVSYVAPVLPERAPAVSLELVNMPLESALDLLLQRLETPELRHRLEDGIWVIDRVDSRPARSLAGQRFNLRISNLDLGSALRALFIAGGVNHVIGSAPLGAVTMQAANLDGAAALDTLLRSAPGPGKPAYVLKEGVYTISFRQP